MPFTVTTMFPVVAPVGTGTVREVALQTVGKPCTPLNITVLEPSDEPKFPPFIVISCSTGAEFVERVEIAGFVTVKETLLLPVPPTVT
jgi:hypothetical protein